jgi:DNA-binding winged helix-turn-helix (wHTH) protein
VQAARARTKTPNVDADLFVVRGARLVRRDGVPISAFGPRIFCFGPFELDESRFELRRGGQAVPISRRVFEVLVFLVANASRTVTKRELIDGPYRGEPVTHSALSRTVHLARKALGEDPRAPQLIRTVRREGFCFVPPAQSRTARGELRSP